MTWSRTRNITAAVLLALFWVCPAMAEEEDNSRSVRILDGPATPASAPPAAANPSPPTPEPGSPKMESGLPGTLATAPNPVTPSPSPAAPPVATFSPMPPPISSPAGKIVPVVTNPAELSLEMLPEASLTVGSRVSFRISAKKPGYLVLVDVNSTGKLTQIYPSPASLMAGRGKPNSNFVKPGRPIQIPSPVEPYMGFEFIASPPIGTAMVVAVLSDQSVQLLDLPDIPGALVGKDVALSFLSQLASELRVPTARDGDTRLQRPTWSLSAKFYEIKQAPD